MLHMEQLRENLVDRFSLGKGPEQPLSDGGTQSLDQEKTMPPVVSFVARSGTGKTTLVISVIAELKSRGYTVGAVKHGPPNFESDRPGKDSYRYAQAGADSTLVFADNKLALVKQYQQPPPIREVLAKYFGDVDIILVEGFKNEDLPRIEISRGTLGHELLSRGEQSHPNLLAVATDMQVDVDVPLLDLNDPALIADFISEYFALPSP